MLHASSGRVQLLPLFVGLACERLAHFNWVLAHRAEEALSNFNPGGAQSEAAAVDLPSYTVPSLAAQTGGTSSADNDAADSHDKKCTACSAIAAACGAGQINNKTCTDFSTAAACDLCKSPTAAPVPPPPTQSPTAPPPPTQSPTAPTPSPTAAPTDACVPHIGLTLSGNWAEPYRQAYLPDTHRNITHNGTQVDCNPASCDNPAVCGIPTCQAIDEHRNRHGSPTFAYCLATCNSGCGASCAGAPPGTPPGICPGCCSGAGSEPQCNAFTAALINVSSTTFTPTQANQGMGFKMYNPATRVGTIVRAVDTAGTVMCYPVAETSTSLSQINFDGLFYPNGNNCNPDRLLVCTKLAWAPVPMNPQPYNIHEKMAVLLHKITWCIAMRCDSSPCPQKFYTFKSGRCYRFSSPGRQVPMPSRQASCLAMGHARRKGTPRLNSSSLETNVRIADSLCVLHDGLQDQAKKPTVPAATNILRRGIP